MKTILKVIYIAFMAIFAIILYFQAYNASAYAVYSGYISSAISEKNYEQLGKSFALFNIPYDTQYFQYTETGTNTETVIFNELFRVQVGYGKTDDNKDGSVYDKVENSYFLTVINSDYSIDNVSENGSLSNKTAIRFYSGDKSYDYLMIRNADINSDSYDTNPQTLKAALLNDIRQCTTSYSGYGNIYFLNLNSAVMDQVRAELGGNIDSYNLINSQGKEVYKTKVAYTFDYSEKFFTDIQEWRDNFNMTLDYAAERNGVTKEQNEAAKTFLEELKVEEINAKYSRGYYQSDIYTKNCIWSSVGYVLIFGVCVLLIYLLLFEFKNLKNLFERILHRAVPQNTGSKKTAQQQGYKKPEIVKVPSSKPVEEAKPVIEAPAAPVVEATPVVEEAPAVEEAPVVDAEIVEETTEE